MTILELVGAVALTGLLMTVALPSSSRLVQIYNLRGAARDVYAHLQKARMDAVTGNDRCRISLVSAVSYKIHRDLNGNALQDDGEPVTTVDLSKTSGGVTLAASGTIVFAPNGTAPSSGTITLTNRFNASRIVSVNSAGRIQIN